MTSLIQAQIRGSSDSMYRAISLLRRKSFEVLELEMKKDQDTRGASLRMVIETKQKNNPHSAKLLLEQIVGFETVSYEIYK